MALQLGVLLQAEDAMLLSSLHDIVPAELFDAELSDAVIDAFSFEPADVPSSQLGSTGCTVGGLPCLYHFCHAAVPLPVHVCQCPWHAGHSACMIVRLVL